MKRKRSGTRNRSGIWFLATLTLLMLFLTGSYTGCEPEDWILEVNCNDCFGARPDSAKLIVYLTINQENESVPLVFYRGDSKGEVDWLDTATTPELYLDAKIGTTYTVMAEYKAGSKTILAFDSDEMKISDYGENCGDPCFIVKGGIFDVKLKD
jgi:hypothetical protein